jgi:hypothetical protein
LGKNHIASGTSKGFRGKHFDNLVLHTLSATFSTKLSKAVKKEWRLRKVGGIPSAYQEKSDSQNVHHSNPAKVLCSPRSNGKILFQKNL